MNDDRTAPFVGKLFEDFHFTLDRPAVELLGLRDGDLVRFTLEHVAIPCSWIGRVHKQGLSRSLRGRPSAHVRSLLGLRPGQIIQGTVTSLTRRRRR